MELTYLRHGQLVKPGQETREEFGEMIMTADSDVALRVLRRRCVLAKEDPRRECQGERTEWVVGCYLTRGVQYLWDVTIIHNDFKYIQYSDELRSKSRGDDPQAQGQFKRVKEDPRPLYCVRVIQVTSEKIETNFDLTDYQLRVCQDEHQIWHVTDFKVQRNTTSLTRELGSSEWTPGSDTIPLHGNHVFQTIFLDKHGSSDLWGKDGIVPWMMMMINGKVHLQTRLSCFALRIP